MKQFDYLIVGAGLFGATFAHEMSKRGKTCLVIDRRQHTGGNVYCEDCDGIHVHTYGAHIFHTNDEKIWNYVRSFVTFNRYTNSPLAMYRGKLYNLPFNMNTFQQLWGVVTPEEAQRKIQEQIKEVAVQHPRNLEEKALSLVGIDIYNYFIKEYTEKQWGRSGTQLPAEIIERIPVRFTYDNNYFNDRYQGIPVGGYNQLVNALLKGIEVKLNTDYIVNRSQLDVLAEKIVYTGMLDELFDFKFGPLEYRSLRFEHERKEICNYQGNAVINYTEMCIPYTRTIEHKHFEFGRQPHTVITREYPLEYTPGNGAEPYYPINDYRNNHLYNKYRQLALSQDNLLFGGRLGDFQYYDMHQVIASALKAVQKETLLPILKSA